MLAGRRALRPLVATSLTTPLQTAYSYAQKFAQSVVVVVKSRPIMNLITDRLRWCGFALPAMLPTTHLGLQANQPWVWVIEFKRVQP